jgi:hypothetical protein
MINKVKIVNMQTIKLTQKNEPVIVRSAQMQLNHIYKLGLDEDGIYGNETYKAICKFQSEHSLLVDGEIGDLTWARLFEIPAHDVIRTSNVLSLAALNIAETQIQVREATGHNDGKEVETYLRSVGLDKGYSWCMAFVYYCYQQASSVIGVPNPLKKTGGVLDQWQASSREHRVVSPQGGDIFIMDFGGGAGHTGIIQKVDGTTLFTVEGNTNAQNSREGDGVYNRSRKLGTIKGFLRF